MTRIRFTQTLLARFLLIGFAAVLFGAGVRYIQFAGFLRDEIIQVVSKQQTALASYVANDVDSQLELRRGSLRRLAAALPIPLLKQDKALRDWLTQQHALLPLFSQGLAVLDAGGHVLSSDTEVPALDDASLQAALSGQVVIARPTLASPAPQRLLPMAAPVLGPDGKVQALLVGSASLAADGFLNRLLRARVGSSGGLLLVSPADKLIIAATDPARAFTPTPPPGVSALYDQRLQQGYRGSGITRDAAGVEEISTAASVPSTGWFVAVHMPTSEALAAVYMAQHRLIWQTALAGGIVLLAVGALFAWVMRPLYKAAVQADRMTNGDQPLAPLPVVRADELGHLTSAFNRLLDKLESQKASLLLMANQDALTGLPNRKLLADRMLQALARARRHGGGTAALFMDLNGFKQINDTYGHEAGDEVLMEVALRLNRVVRQSDTLARLGGDEFVLLATDLGIEPEQALRKLAHKCIEAVQQPLLVAGSARNLGVAIGIALANKDSTPDSLLMAADKAMYQAKQHQQSGFVMAPATEPLGTALRG